jgi:fucose 4-O-acetylase-like acetyltransferase
MSSPKRIINFDLLRILTMFLVVVVHMSHSFSDIRGVRVSDLIFTFAIICDPIFFFLSGYFSIVKLKTSLKEYYYKKVVAIILPLVVYSIVLYLYSHQMANLSLGTYLSSTMSRVAHGWWFIPTLIPFLIIAPFLYTSFNALTDRQVLLISKIVFYTFSWGIISGTILWFAKTNNMLDLTSLFKILTRFFPTWVIPGSGYFIFFCFGYFYKRLNLILTDVQKKKLLFIGLVAWVLDIICAYFKINRVDPSYFWIFNTIAVFIVFNRINFSHSFYNNIIVWISNRTYSIYLLQFTTISVLTQLIYTKKILGDVNAMHFYFRIPIWILTTISAFLLALFFAAIFDYLLLKPAQKLFMKLVTYILKKKPQDYPINSQS